jgi:hypothetical protein
MDDRTHIDLDELKVADHVITDQIPVAPVSRGELTVPQSPIPAEQLPVKPGPVGFAKLEREIVGWIAMIEAVKEVWANEDKDITKWKTTVLTGEAILTIDGFRNTWKQTRDAMKPASLERITTAIIRLMGCTNFCGKDPAISTDVLIEDTCEQEPADLVLDHACRMLRQNPRPEFKPRWDIGEFLELLKDADDAVLNAARDLLAFPEFVKEARARLPERCADWYRRKVCFVSEENLGRDMIRPFDVPLEYRAAMFDGKGKWAQKVVYECFVEIRRRVSGRCECCGGWCKGWEIDPAKVLEARDKFGDNVFDQALIDVEAEWVNVHGRLCNLKTKETIIQECVDLIRSGTSVYDSRHGRYMWDGRVVSEKVAKARAEFGDAIVYEALERAEKHRAFVKRWNDPSAQLEPDDPCPCGGERYGDCCGKKSEDGDDQTVDVDLSTIEVAF